MCIRDRVGVYATNTITDLFFRQAVGRLVRTTSGRRQQRAYMFIPDEPRLRAFAGGIAEQRRHSLRKPERDEDRLLDEPPEERAAPEQDQLSLFSAISAVPLDEHGNPLDAAPVDDPEASADAAAAPDDEIPGLVGEDEDLPTPAPFSLSAPEFEEAVPTPEPAATLAQSPRSKKRRLREQNSAIVRALVHKTGQGHAAINACLLCTSDAADE